MCLVLGTRMCVLTNNNLLKSPIIEYREFRRAIFRSLSTCLHSLFAILVLNVLWTKIAHVECGVI